ncbi:MAG: arsenate reductase ArsC [Bacilli bacterium]|nr:arsenate reductase ArsC [Bacilli bacterium]
MINVLFVCVHNSARSQMAEAYLNIMGKGVFHARSAGLEPGKLNPNVVLAMQEDGIDISLNDTKSTNDMLEKGYAFDHLVTVCDEANGERCPIFAGVKQKHHWDLPDPSSFKGTQEQILIEVRKVRDEIKNRISRFINDHQNEKQNQEEEK